MAHMNYANGITLYQAKRFVSFLFGADNLISSKKDSFNRCFKFYFDADGFNDRTRAVKEAFEMEYPNIKIILIDRH